jgi:hypothetical protein
MEKINYKTLWAKTGAKDNGVAYSTFYRRVRCQKESLEEASRPPRNQRELTKLSCLHGKPRDKNSIGFRPLKGDGARLDKILEQGTDTKQDVMAQLFRDWLDRHKTKPY